MKILKKIVALSFSLLMTVSLFGCNIIAGPESVDGSLNNDFSELNISSLFAKEETIALKEYYQFEKVTYQGYNLDYEVQDSTGQEVVLNNFGFIALDINGYSVTVKVRETGETYSYNLKVKDLNAPIVSYIRNYRNVLVNEPVEIVLPNYHDNNDVIDKLKVESIISYNGELVQTLTATDKTFTPNKVGKYILRTTVADTQGNETSVDYIYNVVENKEYANKVFYFDEAEGVNCLKDLIAAQVSYNTNKQYCHGEEKGSTKIFIDGTHLNPRLALNYPLIDLTNYTEIYFWIYNDTSYRLGLFFNMSAEHIELQPNSWAKFTIPVASLVDNETINKNQYDFTDITGLQIFFHGIDHNEIILDTATVYFSAVYAK